MKKLIHKIRRTILLHPFIIGDILLSIIISSVMAIFCYDAQLILRLFFMMAISTCCFGAICLTILLIIDMVSSDKTCKSRYFDFCLKQNRTPDIQADLCKYFSSYDKNLKIFSDIRHFEYSYPQMYKAVRKWENYIETGIEYDDFDVNMKIADSISIFMKSVYSLEKCYNYADTFELKNSIKEMKDGQNQVLAKSIELANIINTIVKAKTSTNVDRLYSYKEICNDFLNISFDDSKDFTSFEKVCSKFSEYPEFDKTIKILGQEKEKILKNPKLKAIFNFLASEIKEEKIDSQSYEKIAELLDKMEKILDSDLEQEKDNNKLNLLCALKACNRFLD